jgi:hypothetical protein
VHCRLSLRVAAVVVVLGAAAVFGALRAGGEGSERPLAIESSGAMYSSLEQLVDASDVVIIGRAHSVSSGRTFGSADGGAVRSQVVELEVGAVLAGDTPGAVVALEEEATTADGRAVVVDGLRPTRVGDQGLFFLVRGADPAVPYYATVSTAGRYLRRSTKSGDDRLMGARASGQLAAQLADMGGRRLTDAVVARARATGRPVGPLPT